MSGTCAAVWRLRNCLAYQKLAPGIAFPLLSCSGKMASYDLANPAVRVRRALRFGSLELLVSWGKLSRREWLQRASRIAAVIPLSGLALPAAASPQTPQQPQQNVTPPPASGLASLFNGDPTKYRFTREEDRFLEEVERASFQFFWDQVNPYTGLIKDRGQAGGPDTRNVASIAATGFGLTGLCIADRRGWEDRRRIRERVRNTLRFVLTRVPQAHGFFCHFLNVQNGERVFQSEVSSIDTAIFICGVLTCRAYFDDDEIDNLATKLYERVDWGWLLHGQKTLCMGWTPEHGFIHARWDAYSELMMIYLLALGSPSNVVPRESWDAWTRTYFEFNGIRYIGSHAPLFVHQYSHAWFDFRNKKDKYADYFTNSVIATKVHKLWCLELAREFPDYTEDLWGITASDSARGYAVWGGPPAMGRIDGSVVPCAAGGSLPFLPEETLRVLRNIREKYERRAWKKYGFVDAFNPLTNWYSQDVIGIDVGIIMVMAENARTGFIWDQFMRNDVAKNGMAKAGFKSIPSSEGPAPPKSPIPNGYPMYHSS